MKIYIEERGHRAQCLASTKKLAGALQRAASPDPKSDSFSTHPQSREGWVEKLYRTQSTSELGHQFRTPTKSGRRNKTRGVGQI
jgi:hypothetical protein